jgi:signal transduction histidine kinase
MRFRTRLLVTFLVVALVPLVALALVVHNQVTERLTAQYETRVDAMAALIAGDLAAQRDAVAASIAQVRASIADDNRFRKATTTADADDRRYILDYAGGAMRLAGLSMLQIQDERGRIVSSGHFRNDYDRIDADLPRLLESAPGHTGLVEARTAGSLLLVLAGVDSVAVGNRRFTIIGGVDVKTRVLRAAGDDMLSVALILPGDSATAPGARDAIVRDLPVPYIGLQHATLATAAFRVSHRLDELHAVRHGIDRLFVIVVIVTGIVAILIAGWSASRISRPIAELAGKTARVDLDRLDVDFTSDRADEIGVLARGLGAMTARIRESATQVRDAERRAAVGDLARQVNHDIKNGLTPIRNVFSHLVEEAGTHPERVADVLNERRVALDSSIAYLEALAANYARLSRPGQRHRLDISKLVRHVVDDRRTTTPAMIETHLGGGVEVIADPLSLRRVVENLVDNAIDSLEGAAGHVAVETEIVRDATGPCARLVVRDTGVGMPAAQQARIFEDFYTTKAGGTGLGLSIVRRLVMDVGGSIQVDSEVGRGTRFVIDIPLAADAAHGEDG